MIDTRNEFALFSFYLVNWGSDYALVGFGKLCMESRLPILADFKECKSAAKFYDKTFAAIETDHNYPKGCYVEKYDYVYFNSHQIGSKSSLANPICKQKGM